MPFSLIDIGANLAHDSFDQDRDEVIANAHAAGVAQIVVTGSCDDSNRKAAALARTMPGVLFATAGVHPHHAEDYTAGSDAIIRELATAPEVVAVGECGLDFFRDLSPRPAQARAFAAQLAIAAELQMPVFLHQRDAFREFVELLAPCLGAIPRAVAHCFTGNGEELDALIDLDLYIGITGWICDERRGQHLKEIVNRIPANRLMLETDAPYLLPRTLDPLPKTRRNEPRWLSAVLDTVAEGRGESPEEVAKQTTSNARRFFELPVAHA